MSTGPSYAERTASRPAHGFAACAARAFGGKPCARETAQAVSDEGSILPLVIGYAVLALTVVLVCVSATSLYIAQKRLDGIADAAALAASDGFALTLVDGEPQAALTSDDVHEQAAALVAAAGEETVLASANTPDGASARVTVTGVWHPPVFSLFVPDGVALSATATSRTALR